MWIQIARKGGKLYEETNRKFYLKYMSVNKILNEVKSGTALNKLIVYLLFVVREKIVQFDRDHSSVRFLKT